MRAPLLTAPAPRGEEVPDPTMYCVRPDCWSRPCHEHQVMLCNEFFDPSKPAYFLGNRKGQSQTALRQHCCQCGKLDRMANSHFIPAGILAGVGWYEASFDGEQTYETANSSNPNWTRLLLCSDCEGEQGDAVVTNINVGGKKIVQKNAYWRTNHPSPRVTRIINAQEKSALKSLIWRCRLKLAIDLCVSDRAQDAAKMMREEIDDVMIWIDHPAPLLSSVMPSPKLASDQRDIQPYVEYQARFFICSVDTAHHIQMGFIHLFTDQGYQRMGFSGNLRGNLVYQCDPPDQLVNYLRDICAKYEVDMKGPLASMSKEETAYHLIVALFESGEDLSWAAKPGVDCATRPDHIDVDKLMTKADDMMAVLSQRNK